VRLGASTASPERATWSVVKPTRRLLADDVSLIRWIDRSEHVEVQYRMIDGRLQKCPQ